MSLGGKVVLITGTNVGLGTAVTKAFLDAGAQVVGVSRSIRDSDFPHENFVAMPAELSNGDAAQDLVVRVIAKCARINVLVHLVGAFTGGKSIHESDDAAIDKMLDVNFRSALYIVRAVLPQMRANRSGRILAIGSRAAVQPQAGIGGYSISKAALLSLIGTVAVENKAIGITANTIVPGTIATPQNRAAMPGADYTKWVQPDQIAAMLVHLASDQASQITGAVIPIYGGQL